MKRRSHSFGMWGHNESGAVQQTGIARLDAVALLPLSCISPPSPRSASPFRTPTKFGRPQSDGPSKVIAWGLYHILLNKYA